MNRKPEACSHDCRHVERWLTVSHSTATHRVLFWHQRHLHARRGCGSEGFLPNAQPHSAWIPTVSGFIHFEHLLGFGGCSSIWFCFTSLKTGEKQCPGKKTSILLAKCVWFVLKMVGSHCPFTGMHVLCQTFQCLASDDLFLGFRRKASSLLSSSEHIF